MGGTLVYSDPHFYHEGIVSYAGRPFKNAARMNNILIRQFNKIVNPDDVVYFLGDLGCNIRRNQLADIIGKMNGKKILIPGNHDTLSIFEYYDCGFAGVYGHLKLNYEGREIYLAHDPCWALLPNSLWFCGHVHNMWLKLVTKTNTTVINASVEMWDYRPVFFEEMLAVADMDKNYITELTVPERNKIRYREMTHFYQPD